MSDAWAVVIGGVGGAALTGVVSWLIVWRQDIAHRKTTRRQELREAYAGLLGHSAIVLLTANAMHQTMAARSGLAEGLSVTFGMRDALDPLKLWETARTDQIPLIVSWSQVWAVATPEGVQLGNVLLQRCGELTESATSRGQARTPLMRALAGEKWTHEQLDAWKAATKAVAEARRDLGNLARRELGYEVAELFTPGAAGAPAEHI